MSYITGKVIKELREKQQLTQKELAEKIMVSDKTISKWETQKGLPDIAVMEDLAKVLGVSISELFTGELRTNSNQSGNMKKAKFYVCPICGNVITAVGEGVYSCCGVTLLQQEAESADESHDILVETIEHEFFISSAHSMSKKHYISFIAYVTNDSIEVKKLYPEQDISVRFRKKGSGIFYVYCNMHGMFYHRV